MAPVFCCLCREQLDRKRGLYTPNNVPIVHAINDLVEGMFGRGVEGEIFPPDASICRPCNRSVQQLMRLRKQFKEKEREIKEKVGLTRE